MLDCLFVCVTSIVMSDVQYNLLDYFKGTIMFIQLNFFIHAICPYSREVKSVLEQVWKVCVCMFRMYLPFQLSYDSDGTTVLCMELSQKVSDGVWGTRTSAAPMKVQTWLYACVHMDTSHILHLKFIQLWCVSRPIKRIITYHNGANWAKQWHFYNHSV